MLHTRQNLTRRLSLLAALSVVSMTLLAPAQAADAGPALARYGSVATEQAASKTIVITEKTKWVNVDDGDTVRFVKGDQSFTFHFDTLRGEQDFKLSIIAPQAMMLDRVKVYVGSNPLYRG